MAARTCVSKDKCIREEDLERFQKTNEALVKDLLESGHHSTMEHSNFVFALEGLSRYAIWSFFHNHPFYSSEQVSQRYVSVRENYFVTPPLPSGLGVLYKEHIQILFQAYQKLIFLMEEEWKETLEKKDPQDHKARKKRIFEAARAVLPLGTATHLYHTINSLTLFRYYALIQGDDVLPEVKETVKKMVQAVIETDSRYEMIFENIRSHEWRETRPFDSPDFSWNQYCSFSLKEKTCILLPGSENNDILLADLVRGFLGKHPSLLPKEEAIRIILHPHENPRLAEPINITLHDSFTKILSLITYRFYKKHSLATDLQEQRHRAVSAIRPRLEKHFLWEPDYHVPLLFKRLPRARVFYDEAMKHLWERIQILEQKGLPRDYLPYLLPNAAYVCILESSNLLYLRHHASIRLCYLAQHEIWERMKEAVLHIREVNPVIGQYLLPPCTPRKAVGETPYCPEGKRFCGVRVWDLDVKDYERIL